MNKFTIDNRTQLTDIDVMLLITDIVKQGRISNHGKQYCYGTSIKIEDKQYMIFTDLNKKSERFVITQRYENNT